MVYGVIMFEAFLTTTILISVFSLGFLISAYRAYRRERWIWLDKTYEDIITTREETFTRIAELEAEVDLLRVNLDRLQRDPDATLVIRREIVQEVDDG
mgnify:CR=1 FL=1